MFNITLTRQQLYELYNEWPDVTIHLIESLMGELADFEQIIGRRQQRVSDPQRKRDQRQARQVERVKEELWRQQSLNRQLPRRIRELGQRWSGPWGEAITFKGLPGPEWLLLNRWNTDKGAADVMRRPRP